MNKFFIYIDFIRNTLEGSKEVSTFVNIIDWSDFLEFCCRQGIQGIVWGGIERAKIKIPQSVLFEWIGVVEQTKTRNITLNRQCVEVSSFFAELGYHSCILKGQLNALFYPKPELRSPGDIDVWVSREGGNNNYSWSDEREEIIKMIRGMYPKAYFVWHHIDFPLFSETSVEVHFIPVHLNNWYYNRRVKRYMLEQRNRQFSHRVNMAFTSCEDKKADIGALTNDFNIIYLMLHMYKHCFTSGNNLKQLIDYYCLLKKWYAERNCQDEKKDFSKQFAQFGILKYAKGVMWVLKEKLGLNEEYLIVDYDEKFGRILLKDMFQYGINIRRDRLGLIFGRFMDNLHLVQFFPIEVLIAPLHLIWLKCWKQTMKN